MSDPRTGDLIVDAAPRFGEVPRGLCFVRWAGTDLSLGVFDGAVMSGEDVRISAPAGQPGHDESATWTSPEVALGFPATDVIASWTATTVPGTWLQTDLRGETEQGVRTKWFVMGRWTADDESVLRTSVGDQRDALGDVVVDRFVAAEGHALMSIQLRVTLHRPAGAASTPRLHSVAAVATPEPDKTVPATSAPRDAREIVLPVPGLSQHVHRGEYPQWAGGGEAWCSPTSVAMVLAFWGVGPSAADCAWVDPAYADPCVHHAVRGVYDYGYCGAGNWPFNIAYASQLGLTGFVTKLQSLRDAESFIAAGIPLVLSVSFDEHQIAGLGYATSGHLLVLVGFTAGGDPVLNDPAAPRNEDVRKTVHRAELEAAWLSSTHGVVYVLYPSGVAVPNVPAEA